METNLERSLNLLQSWSLAVYNRNGVCESAQRGLGNVSVKKLVGGGAWV